MGSSTIANGGNNFSLSVITGSSTFNAGTSTLNLGGGSATLDTNGLQWYNITFSTSAVTYTLNSSLTNLNGNFYMPSSTITITNGNLYWNPAGTLTFGTGAVGFTFNVPRTVTVQNLSINSAGGMVLNTNTINVTGNLTMLGAATAVGTTQINLIGTGTWSNVLGPTTWLRNPVTINTSGTITLGATIAIINTTTYSAGTIDAITNSNTLFVNSTTLVGFGSTSSSYLNNLTLSGGTTVIINASVAYFRGTVTYTANSNMTFTSSSTFGFSTNILSCTVAATHTFKALTEYIVRGQLILRGVGVTGTTVTLTSSVANPSNRSKLTLAYGATQTVSFINAQYIDSSAGQTIWNYRPHTNATQNINWGSLATPGTISSTFAY
jgi:hypothetical protein